VRRYGGVLEHPAYSDAWDAFGLNAPPTGGGWIKAGLTDPGWTCYVEQHPYGHVAKKATWLYAVVPYPPTLRWGHVHDAKCSFLVSWCGNRIKSGNARSRLKQTVASRTPPEFRDELLRIARSAHGMSA